MDISEIKIEKGIKIPEHRNKWYPVFKSMNVGDSFKIGSRSLAGSAAHAARKLGFKAATRQLIGQGKAMRVWRIK